MMLLKGWVLFWAVGFSFMDIMEYVVIVHMTSCCAMFVGTLYLVLKAPPFKLQLI